MSISMMAAFSARYAFIRKLDSVSIGFTLISWYVIWPLVRMR